jgi:hypothetical protein
MLTVRAAEMAIRSCAVRSVMWKSRFGHVGVAIRRDSNGANMTYYQIKDSLWQNITGFANLRFIFYAA